MRALLSLDKLLKELRVQESEILNCSWSRFLGWTVHLRREMAIDLFQRIGGTLEHHIIPPDPSIKGDRPSLNVSFRARSVLWSTTFLNVTTPEAAGLRPQAIAARRGLPAPVPRLPPQEPFS